MSTDFNLISELHDKTLVIKTEGYINNIGGLQNITALINLYSIWKSQRLLTQLVFLI